MLVSPSLPFHLDLLVDPIRDLGYREIWVNGNTLDRRGQRIVYAFAAKIKKNRWHLFVRRRENASTTNLTEKKESSLINGEFLRTLRPFGDMLTVNEENRMIRSSLRILISTTIATLPLILRKSAQPMGLQGFVPKGKTHSGLSPKSFPWKSILSQAEEYKISVNEVRIAAECVIGDIINSFNRPQ